MDQFIICILVLIPWGRGIRLNWSKYFQILYITYLSAQCFPNPTLVVREIWVSISRFVLQNRNSQRIVPQSGIWISLRVSHFLFWANRTLVFTDESLLMSLFPSFSTIGLTMHDSVGESPSVCETAIFITSHGLDLLETSVVLAEFPWTHQLVQPSLEMYNFL